MAITIDSKGNSMPDPKPVPCVGQIWWVKLPQENELSALKIETLTEKVVTLKSAPVGLYAQTNSYSYKVSDVEFVEKYAHATL